MTVTTPDTITPGGAFPVAKAGDIALANGTTAEDAFKTISLRMYNLEGINGLVLLDGNGNEFGFLPLDASRSTLLPNINISPGKAVMGPLKTTGMSGTSAGFSLTDDFGSEFAFIPLDRDRDLTMPYIRAAADRLQAGPLRAFSVVGPTGVSLVDDYGSEVAFFPFDSQGLRLPFVRADAGKASIGPFVARLIEGVDGVVFVDSYGNGVSVGGGSATGGSALDKAAVLKLGRPSNSVVTQGHSKTQQCSWGGTANVNNPNGGTARKADLGWLAWADYYLRGSINWVWNAGVGGEQDSSILARMVTDVVAKDPAWCFMMGGTCNSINGDKTAAQIIAMQLGTETQDSSNSMLGVLQAAGIRTLWLTDPTWHTGHADLTPAKIAILNQVNRAMLRAPGYKSGLIAVDAAGLIIDPASATGSARDYYLQDDDNIHPSPLGARGIGYLLAQRLLAAGFPMMDILVASASDNYGNSSTSKQLVDNPLMIGTAGTGPSGNVVSGSIPTGYRIAVVGSWPASSILSSLVPRADGYGNDWVVSVPNAPAADAQVFMIGADVRTRMTTGDVIEAAAQIDVTGMAAVKGHELVCDLSTDLPTNPAVSTLERDAATNWGHLFYSQADLVGGVMKTGRASVPSGALTSSSGSLRFRVTFGASGGTAVVKMSRTQILKNS